MESVSSVPIAVGIDARLFPSHFLSGPDRSAEAAPRIDQRLEGSDALSLRSLGVLWIDDEVHPDDPAVHFLKAEGLRIDCAASGFAGLALGRSNRHDVIILDLRLPDMSGLAVLERMKAEKIQSPTMVLTGYADLETAVAAMRLGAVDFRKKPLFGDQLVDAVRVVAQQQATRGWNHDVANEMTHDLGELLRSRAEDRGRLAGALIRAVGTPDLDVQHLLAYAAALRYVVAEPVDAPFVKLIDRIRQLTSSIPRPDVSHNATARAAVERLVRLVNNHERPSEEDLAAEIGIDAAHLGRLIRRESGLGFREWRRALVMRSAVRMLTATDEHVDQIAYRVGFEHPSQFDREFRELVGTSPTTFRRLFKGYTA